MTFYEVFLKTAMFVMTFFLLLIGIEVAFSFGGLTSALGVLFGALAVLLALVVYRLD